MSDSLVSEQGKKNDDEYPKGTSYEEILEEFKCSDHPGRDSQGGQRGDPPRKKMLEP